MDAVDMIRRCYHFQHPEAFGRPAVNEGAIPSTLRYGPGDTIPDGENLPLEPMGHPEAVPLGHEEVIVTP